MILNPSTLNFTALSMMVQPNKLLSEADIPNIAYMQVIGPNEKVMDSFC